MHQMLTWVSIICSSRQSPIFLFVEKTKILLQVIDKSARLSRKCEPYTGRQTCAARAFFANGSLTLKLSSSFVSIWKT